MIVVDSSVWIDHLNGRPGPEVARLQHCLDSTRVSVIVGDLILLEVLAGLRTPRMVTELRQLLESLELVGMVGPALAARAVEHVRQHRAVGVTARAVDLLIATYGVAAGAALLTRDRDFQALAAPSGLQLVDASAAEPPTS